MYPPVSVFLSPICPRPIGFGDVIFFETTAHQALLRLLQVSIRPRSVERGNGLKYGLILRCFQDPIMNHKWVNVSNALFIFS